MNKIDYDRLYFAQKEAKDMANILLTKADRHFTSMESNGYLDKIRMMWGAYYGAQYDSLSEGHQIRFTGEQGELVQFSINHLRNIARNILTLVTSNRPALRARAVNTDSKSIIQARLANGVLDYYMREKRLERYIKDATETAIVMGSAYIKLSWNQMLGDVYDKFESEAGEIVEEREGDLEFAVLSPFDVVVDSSREDQYSDWYLCRSFKNRHDLIAKYPELAEEILAIASKNALQNYLMGSAFYESDDLIPVYEFYHERTEAKPDGRYAMFLSSDAVLSDGPLPYSKMPIYKISYSNILGTPFSYTDLFDLLPIQDALNSLHSTILTNQNAFGVQNVIVPKTADITVTELSGGLNFIEADERNGQIRPLNLTSTPPEIFNYAAILEKQMETISGINSVIRGNPEKNLRSANALALIQSNSLQYLNGLQTSYIQLNEDVGTGVIHMLKDFANTPRMAAIVGQKNQYYLQEFMGSDLSSINRVIVDTSNPLAATAAGRLEMAEQLLQMKLITTVEQYINVLNSGNLDVMIENTQSELDLIRKENEALTLGKDVIATPLDEHEKHIKEHRSVISDPELRKDPAVLKRVLDHVMEHITFLRTTDPDLLAIIREQPLAPAGGSPTNQPPQGVPAGSMTGNQISQDMAPPATPPIGQANMPSPPAPFEAQQVTVLPQGQG